MDLETLWFVLIVVLWAGYFVLEGFDFGVGMLLPFVPRDEEERGTLLRSIAPVWDGNEVWLVVAGGATFAAFPAWYATMFSGFYLALLLVLFLLIIRVVSFEWRSKSESPRWRSFWTVGNTIGSFGAPLVWGIGLSALSTAPRSTPTATSRATSGISSAPTPSSPGRRRRSLRVPRRDVPDAAHVGELRDVRQRAARRLAVRPRWAQPSFSCGPSRSRSTNDKDVFPPALPAASESSPWRSPCVLPLRGRNGRAFSMTGSAIVAFVATLFTSLYPRVMVSNPDFDNSLTVDGAASSHYALQVMSVVALIFVPLVLLYQGWTYYVFRRRLGGDHRV